MHIPRNLLIALVASALAVAHLHTPGGTILPKTNIGGTPYPRITSDRRVPFRVKAPNAQKVEFNLGKLYAAERRSPHEFAPLLFEGGAGR